VELVQNLSDIVEGLSEEEAGLHRQLLERIQNRIETIFEVPPLSVEAVRLDLFLADVCKRAATAAASRQVDIRMDIGPDLWIEMDPTILSKVFDGILKNAVENTPDGGTVDLETVKGTTDITIVFRDTGVGIAAEDQKNIFGGFFHTQSTEMYASKSPYQFDAGGTGSDLMRIEAFARRFGFEVDLTSTRCRYLLSGSSQCPGSISACEYVSSPAACASSGGCAVRIKFPLSMEGTADLGDNGPADGSG
jgi:signal transduction histidine kinase